MTNFDPLTAYQMLTRGRVNSRLGFVAFRVSWTPLAVRTGAAPAITVAAILVHGVRRRRHSGFVLARMCARKLLWFAFCCRCEMVVQVGCANGGVLVQAMVVALLQLRRGDGACTVSGC